MATDLLKQALDPENDLQHRTVENGDVIECTYNKKKVSYDDFIDIHEERGERLQKGKNVKSVGLFSGFGPGKWKKPYDE